METNGNVDQTSMNVRRELVHTNTNDYLFVCIFLWFLVNCFSFQNQVLFFFFSSSFLNVLFLLLLLLLFLVVVVVVCSFSLFSFFSKRFVTFRRFMYIYPEEFTDHHVLYSVDDKKNKLSQCTFPSLSLTLTLTFPHSDLMHRYMDVCSKAPATNREKTRTPFVLKE